MEKQALCQEDEHSKLIKVLDFRLPNVFKKIGLLGALSIMLLLIGYKFWGDNGLFMKDVMRTIMLLFLLLASLSKDKLEDEFNRHIRFQSYVIAFVCTVAYSILVPLIALVFDLIITKVTADGSVGFYELSAFEVVFNLVALQLLFFETLKRFGRAD